MQFRLKAGIHIQRDDNLPKKENGRPASRVYKAGEIVESKTDLVAKHGGEKFQLISGETGQSLEELEAQQKQLAEQIDLLKRVPQGVTGTPVGTVGDGKDTQGKVLTKADLEALSNKELRLLAADKEVDVETCGNKTELVQALSIALDAK